MTQRTPASMSSRDRLAASRFASCETKFTLARWQQFRKTSSGTDSSEAISAAVIRKPSDSTTPLRGLPSTCICWNTPCAEMCTMRQGSRNSAAKTS